MLGGMTDCPICSTQLQPIDTAPCFDCGHITRELGECRRGEHEYHVLELWGRKIVLCDFCDFCDADFESYGPEYWGLSERPLPDYPLHLVHKLDSPRIEQDLYCASCEHRLAFLLFRAHALTHNAA